MYENTRRDMKILFVSHKIITFILNEVVALNGQGHEVSILTPHNDKNVFKNIVDPFLKKQSARSAYLL